MKLEWRRVYGNKLLFVSLAKSTFGGPNFWYDLNVHGEHEGVTVVGERKTLSGMTDDDAEKIARDALEKARQGLRRMLLDE